MFRGKDQDGSEEETEKRLPDDNAKRQIHFVKASHTTCKSLNMAPLKQ